MINFVHCTPDLAIWQARSIVTLRIKLSTFYKCRFLFNSLQKGIPRKGKKGSSVVRGRCSTDGTEDAVLRSHPFHLTPPPYKNPQSPHPSRQRIPCIIPKAAADPDKQAYQTSSSAAARRRRRRRHHLQAPAGGSKTAWWSRVVARGHV